MEQASNKIYFREVDPQGNDSLSKIAQRIAPDSAVLDLGCGPGALGGVLEAKRCTVDGVEANAEAAALAAPHYRRVVVADLESKALATQFADDRYDYIVCADVLEHLRHPEQLVAQLPSLLKPSGRILLSIPNVSYAGLVGALITGEFTYRSEGLLDATHLRFFTRKSLLRWIEECGLHVTAVDTVGMPLNQSEFAGDQLESLPPAVLRTILAQPDALTYQFIVEVTATKSALPIAIAERPSVPAFTFLAQLFYRGNDPFDQAHASTVHGAMGVDRQRLRFEIPASASDLTVLRFDPTNRPGYLRLYSMGLFSAAGDCVWRWAATNALDPPRSNQLQLVRDADDEGLLLVCEGDDPWFELPLQAEPLSSLRGGCALEVELSWPQSSDSFVVIERLLGRDRQPGRVGELTRLNADMRAHIRTLSVEIKDLQGQLRSARESLARIHRSLTFRIGRPFHAIVNRLRGS
ncbi:MAG: glycosyl transferase family 2 [bacterium]|nr:glycosyl transferase family 2 [bacterium]